MQKHPLNINMYTELQSPCFLIFVCLSEQKERKISFSYLPSLPSSLLFLCVRDYNEKWDESMQKKAACQVHFTGEN